MKKMILINLVVFMMFICVGCLGVEDIDKLYLPTIMTFDKGDKSDNYNVDLVAMNFKGGKILYDFSRLNKESISESIEHTQNIMSGKVSMSLLETIVLGEEFSKESTYSVINWAYKQDINTNISICVYKGGCSELIDKLNSSEDKPSSESKPGEAKPKEDGAKKDTGDKIEYVTSLISEKKKDGYEITQKMNEFVLDNENSSKTGVLPTIKMNNEDCEIVGTTVFKNYDNIGFINHKDTKYLMLIRGIEGYGSTEFKDVDFENKKDKPTIIEDSINKAIESKEREVTNKTGGVVKSSNKRKVKVDKINGKYVFDVFIDLNCDVVENNYTSLNLISNKENLKAIEKYLDKTLEAKCYEFVEKVKTDIGYDVFDLTRYAKVKYSESVEDLKNEKFFENSEINITVKSKINNNSLFN